LKTETLKRVARALNLRNRIAFLRCYVCFSLCWYIEFI